MTLTIVPGQTTYHACFGDVSRFIAGRGNSLRIQVLSWTVPNLDGTTTKSVSFTCTDNSSPSPTPTTSDSGGGGGSGSGSWSGGGGASGTGTGSTIASR